eukprot:TRINITY_DN8149_c0_g1_i3.p2 TRINITY_DN8149_c0_g1~~TRINITY_DN8149_c0_g1_i3.p2  ORF type:complete len:123 (+),score=7.53 TRINITY_DN8149_c0_g1_i3:280-648(+)
MRVMWNILTLSLGPEGTWTPTQLPMLQTIMTRMEALRYRDMEKQPGVGVARSVAYEGKLAGVGWESMTPDLLLRAIALALEGDKGKEAIRQFTPKRPLPGSPFRTPPPALRRQPPPPPASKN